MQDYSFLFSYQEFLFHNVLKYYVSFALNNLPLRKSLAFKDVRGYPQYHHTLISANKYYLI
jgi:hypothetical protein